MVLGEEDQMQSSIARLYQNDSGSLRRTLALIATKKQGSSKRLFFASASKNLAA
jgi:hypothetical protein